MQNNSLKTEPIREDTSGMSHKLKVQYWPIDEVHPYPNNPRNNDDAVEYVANSIREFSFQQPLVVDTDGTIVAGHTRLKAAKMLGMDTVPVVVADNLTPAQVNAYRLADNKVAEAATWDMEALAVELEGLEVDFDMTMFDFDASEFDFGGLGGEPTEIVEDEVPEDAHSIVQKGDVWQLGRHRLMCGDSTDADSVARLMDGTKADMVLTDPPYGMHLDTDFSSIHGSLKSIGRKNGTRGNKYKRVIGDNDDFTPDLISTVFDNLTANEVFLFGADYYAEHIPNRLDGSWLVWDKRKESQADAIGSEFELIWSKCRHKRRVLRHDWFGFLSSENSKDARNRVHPTQKPVTLLTDIIEQWGADAKTIVDLYGGSGSTLIAAEQLDRTCYMMELDPHYCDIIIERWQNLTGQTARKVEQDG